MKRRMLLTGSMRSDLRQKERILALKGNNDGQLADSQIASGEVLRWSQSAIETAKVRAEECEKQGKISHTRPDGTTA